MTDVLEVAGAAMYYAALTALLTNEIDENAKSAVVYVPRNEQRSGSGFKAPAVFYLTGFPYARRFLRDAVHFGFG